MPIICLRPTYERASDHQLNSQLSEIWWKWLGLDRQGSSINPLKSKYIRDLKHRNSRTNYLAQTFLKKKTSDLLIKVSCSHNIEDNRWPSYGNIPRSYALIYKPHLATGIEIKRMKFSIKFKYKLFQNWSVARKFRFSQ